MTILTRLSSISSYLVERSSIKEAPIPAYHGTPYKFNKFDCYYMGKGEGVQSFGWGLYFTTVKEIAVEYYAKRLSKYERSVKWSYESNGKRENIRVEIRNEEFEKFGRIYVQAYLGHGKYFISEPITKDSVGSYASFLAKIKELSDLIHLFLKENDSLRAKQILLDIFRIDWKVNLQMSCGDKNRAFEIIEKMNLFFAQSPLLYEVILWPNKEPDLIQWDDSIMPYQYEKIVAEFYKQKNNKVGDFKIETPYNTPGESVYSNLGYFVTPTDFWNSKQMYASKFLLSAGIDGIKVPSNYFGGGNTDNDWTYVVFDDKEIKVIKRQEV